MISATDTGVRHSITLQGRIGLTLTTPPEKVTRAKSTGAAVALANRKTVSRERRWRADSTWMVNATPSTRIAFIRVRRRKRGRDMGRLRGSAGLPSACGQGGRHA